MDQSTPGFNHLLPDATLTPSTVEASIGALDFFDRIPTEHSLTAVCTCRPEHHGAGPVMDLSAGC